MKTTFTLAAALAATLGFAGSAGAVTQLVGDADGFGISPTTGLVRATGAPHTQPADVDADGRLEPGEYLPDWNADGATAVNRGDDFDFREADELASLNGAQLTDRSITPRGASNNATFTFIFPVPTLGQNDFGVDHYINFVFGDYDVSPASISVDGQIVPLTLQGGGQDGLVQTAFAVVPWADMTDGEVEIRIIATEEPYLAFDYALLDTDQIADQDGDGVPDATDNCIDNPNPGQEDADDDGIGDACDACLDRDDDGVCEPADNCPLVINPNQEDADGDGLGDACDACVFDPSNDVDGDGVCGNADNCPTVPNPGQEDSDTDDIGDACDTCSDADHDGVCSTEDSCEGTVYPETVPTVSLGVNRWVLGPNGVFVTVQPKGKGPRRSYTIEQTHGCSCAQIIDALDLGLGHTKFGCSISAMDEWIAAFN
jgi:hypothetical protein